MTGVNRPTAQCQNKRLENSGPMCELNSRAAQCNTAKHITAAGVAVGVHCELDLQIRPCHIRSYHIRSGQDPEGSPNLVVCSPQNRILYCK
jgi:hypothetical protein